MDAQHIRQRLEQFILQCGFKRATQKDGKPSQYYELRYKGKLQMSVIRLSNHCTNPSNWENRYGSNNPSLELTNKEVQKCRGNYDRLPNKYFKKTFFSFVIFDPVVDGIQQCAKVQMDCIFVNQFIYDATKMTDGMITEIKNKIKQIASNGILEEKIEKDNNTKTQNNMKRKIRLTESQLHSMISESVKQVLSELDWKTYDSAMRKSAKRGEWNRAGKFGDASVQAFNRDFGSNESPYDYNYSRANVPFRTKYKGEDKDGNEIWDGTQSNYGFYDDGVYACSDSNYPGVHEVIPTGSRQWQHRRTPDGKVHTSMKDIDKYTDNDDYNKRDNEYDYWYNRSGEDPTRAKAMQKARKGAKETMNYLNGKYDYEPNGRGWHLK